MPDPIRVTPDNFTRAESDMYFAAQVKDGAFGRFHHLRELADVRHQSVVAMNRDTLYSVAVFDLDAGPVTITLPDSKGRFMSMEVINEDQYALEVVYGGVHTLTRERIGTRYVQPVIRTLADPNDPTDIAAVHALQDAIVVRQANPGRFETPNWDPVSQKQVREALDALGKTMTDSSRTFGPPDKVDPVRHLIGTAIGWGGNPEADAYYIMTAAPQNDARSSTVCAFQPMCRSMGSGRSASMTRTAISPRTSGTPTVSTASSRARIRTAALRYSSAVRAGPISCRSRLAGNTACASIAPDRKS